MHALRVYERPHEIIIGERAVHEVILDLASTGTVADRAVFGALAKRHEAESLSKIVDVYIACFTEDPEAHAGDELTQWRGYGDAGSGYSLGLFPAPNVATEPNRDARLSMCLVRVEYDKLDFQSKTRACLLRLLGVHNSQESLGIGRGSRAVACMMQQAGALVTRLKSDFFASEREWRYVVMNAVSVEKHCREDVRFSPTARGLVPYVELPLTGDGENDRLPVAGVFTGPGPRGAHRLSAAKMLLSKHGYSPNLAKSSRGALGL